MTDGKTDRETAKKTDICRQKNGKADIQNVGRKKRMIDRKVDRLKQTDRETDRMTDRQRDGKTYRRKDQQTYRQHDGRDERQTDRQIDNLARSFSGVRRRRCARRGNTA